MWSKLVSRNFNKGSGSFLIQWRSVSSAQQQVHTTPVNLPEEKAVTTPGRFYNEMLFRGRKGNLLALGDLRKLLQMCSGPDDLTYAVNGVKLYQTKGQDFSEEVCSHFIRACIRCQSPKAAAEEIIRKKKNRIGAWLAPKSFQNLIESIQGPENVDLLANLTSTALSKGLQVSEESLRLLLQVAVNTNHVALHEAAMHGAQRSNAELANTLLKEFPRPQSSTAPAAAENSTGDVK